MIDTWQQTHFARHANPKVLYDGLDTPYLYRNVSSMQYTDYAEGSSDEISITLTDQERTWLGGWFPERGHKLTVILMFTTGINLRRSTSFIAVISFSTI